MIKAAVIGDPIGHSLSPAIFSALARLQNKKDFSYEAVRVERSELQRFIAMARKTYVGCNVTIPHKESVAGLINEASAEARAVGAINVVAFSGKNGEKAVGHNTDVFGIEQTLKDVAKGPTAVILGAGGAARAAAYVLGKNQTSEITIVNRDTSRAKKLCDDFASLFPKSRYSPLSWDEFFKHNVNGRVSLIIQSTPLGMTGFDEQRDLFSRVFSETKFATDATAFDVVYRPPDTSFLKMARQKKLKTLGGLDMLVYQALATWEIWLGALTTSDREELKEELSARLSRVLEVGEHNIYLCGFMGAGKSTVGRLLARNLGRQFVDLDKAIEEKTGKPVREIFKSMGEESFRKLETETLRGISARERLVVSLGGGVLTRPANLELLEPGTLVFLAATVQTLAARLKNSREQRPLLSQDQGMSLEDIIAKLLAAREKDYARASITIPTDGLEPAEVAARVLDRLCR